mmetsp:Transcript_31466/g.47568  ORF Transcript_31466/g.47568 Transcript_31466/m.47568 type:complete len:95 (-) Transcript_31466:1761-2045(-)
MLIKKEPFKSIEYAFHSKAAGTRRIDSSRYWQTTCTNKKSENSSHMSCIVNLANHEFLQKERCNKLDKARHLRTLFPHFSSRAVEHPRAYHLDC